MREREMMSQEGVVLINLTLSKDGDIVGTPHIVTSGFLMSRDEEEFKSLTRGKIEDAVLYANGHLQKDVEKAVRNVIYTETRRRPLVVVSVNEI
jgi:mRNA degradation ribonuclease J1/J2